MAKRPSPGNFGLLGGPALLPVLPAPGGQNDVDRELADWVRRRNQLMTVRQITALDQEPAGPAPAVPGPSTLTEAVSAASAIAGLHQGAAQTAMAHAEAAERRAAAAREEAGREAEAARTEERGQSALLFALTEKFTLMNQATMQSAHETQLAMQRQVNEANLQAVNMRVDSIAKNFEQLLTLKDQEIAHLKSTVEGLSTKEGVDQWLTKIIVQGKTDDPVLGLLTRLIGPAQNPGNDPNHIYQMGLAEVEVEKARRLLMVEDQKLIHADKRHEQVSELIGGVGKLIQSAHEWLPDLINRMSGARGDSMNGVPNGFPPPGQGGDVIDGYQ